MEAKETRSPEEDLQRLVGLAYHRRETAEPTVRAYHKVRAELGAAALDPLELLYEWLFVPLTLWPFNVEDLLLTALAQVGTKRGLGEELRCVLENMPFPPPKPVCEAVAEHEHQVQQGRYETLLTHTAKFDCAEAELAREPQLIAEWKRIKKLWDVTNYQDHKGVIRRTLTSERNLRQPFELNWSKKPDRFRAAFDAFCLKWNLYGMQHDQPLLIKLTVNLTPHGTMIYIPAYWSFDSKRDVRWGAVTKLHRVRVPGKQGPALAEGLQQRREMAGKLRELDRQAKRLGLKGDAKHSFLCKGLGLVEATDPKRISRLRKEFAS